MISWKWEGTQDAKRGLMKLKQGDRKVCIELYSFRDAHELGQLMRGEYFAGFKDGKTSAVEKIENTLREMK